MPKSTLKIGEVIPLPEEITVVGKITKQYLCQCCGAEMWAERPKDMERKGWYKTKNGWKCKECHELGN